MPITSFGKYTVLRPLGSGGMASVYEATDPHLDRHVAIKVIHSHLTEEKNFGNRFLQEARLVASLRHPQIIHLYDFDILDGQPYMVMEYLAGGTLKDRLDQLHARGEAFPLGWINAGLQRICQGLFYAHQHAAVHRDIKPANILFTSQEEPVVTDFGIAKILNEAMKITATGGIIGTPAYMSPEQVSGQPIDPRSDQYSLAVMVYELVTRRVPFTGETATTILMKHLNEAPPPPKTLNPNLPTAIQEVLLQALSKNPDDRFPNVLEFAAAFEKAQFGQSPSSRPALAPTSPLDATIDAPLPSITTPQLIHSTTPPPSYPVDPVKFPSAEEQAAPPSLSTPPLLHSSTPPLDPTLDADVPTLAGTLPGKSPSSEERAAPPSLSTPQLINSSTPLQSHPADPVHPVKFPSRFPPLKSLFSTLAPSRLLPIGLAVLLLTAILIFLGFGGLDILKQSLGSGSKSPTELPASAYTIAVADFDGTGASIQVDFGRRIYEQLTADLASLEGNVQVVRTQATYSDSASARAAASRLSAAILIWGWYDDLGVSPHIEVVNPAPPPTRDAGISILEITSAQAAEPLAESAPGLLTVDVAHIAATLKIPRMLSELEFFVENGPEQITYLSEAVLGLAFQASGDQSNALTLYDQAIAAASQFAAAESPNLDLLYLQRGLLYAAQNQYASAIADTEEAARLNPELAEAFYNLAVFYPEACLTGPENLAPQSGSDPLAQALAAAKVSAALLPDDSAARLLLAGLYQRNGQLEAALVEAQAAVQLDPSNAEAQFTLQSVYAALGEEALAAEALAAGVALLEAEAAQDQAAPQDADSASALLDPERVLSLGDVYFQAGDYAQAEAAYQQYEQRTGQPPASGRLGSVYFWQERYPAAIASHQAWVDQEPTNPAAHIALGLAYWRSGDAEQAQAAWDQAIAQSSAETGLCAAAHAHILQGNLAYEQGQDAEAEASFAQVVALQPYNPTAHYLLGTLQYLADDFANAETNLLAALALAPNDPGALRALGSTYYYQGQYQDAALTWEKLVGDPADWDAAEPEDLTFLGNAYEKLDNAAGAIAAYQGSLALEENPSTRYYLGLVYQDQGDLEQAIAAYRLALENAPDDSLVLSSLGDALFQTGDLPGSTAALEQAVAGAPWTRSQLAQVYTYQGQTALAIETLECTYPAGLPAAPCQEAIASEPAFLSQLASLYGRVGRLDEAEAQYQAALTLAAASSTPNRPDLHAGLGSLAYQRCDLSGMSREYSLAASAAPGMSFYQSLPASAYAAAGDYDQRQQVMEKLLADFPDDPIAHLLAGEYYLQTQNYSAAQDELNLALQAGLIPVFASLVHYDLAQVHYRLGSLPAAQGELDLALQTYTAYGQSVLSPAFVLSGDLALLANNPTAALSSYDQAQASLPLYGALVSGDAAELYVPLIQARRGLALRQSGDAAGAAQAFQDAFASAEALVERTPRSPQALLAFGIVQYLGLGEWTFENNSWTNPAAEAAAELTFTQAAACDASLSATLPLTKADLQLLLAAP